MEQTYSKYHIISVSFVPRASVTGDFRCACSFCTVLLLATVTGACYSDALKLAGDGGIQSALAPGLHAWAPCPHSLVATVVQPCMAGVGEEEESSGHADHYTALRRHTPPSLFSRHPAHAKTPAPSAGEHGAHREHATTAPCTLHPPCRHAARVMHAHTHACTPHGPCAASVPLLCPCALCPLKSARRR
jgi:hypothetical protein